MLISAERLAKDESILLLLILSQHGHRTDQRRRTQVETWNSVINRKETVWPRQQEPDLAKVGKCQPNAFLLFLILCSPLITISGAVPPMERKANIEQADQTNKSKEHLATCEPAGGDGPKMASSPQRPQSDEMKE